MTCLSPKEVCTIGDAAQDDRPMTSSILSNYLQEHNSGVDVLSAPLKPEYADMITTPLIQNVCEKAMVQHEYLVVDLSPGLSEHNLTFMEQANKIYIVTDLEMAALKNTKAMIKILRALGMVNGPYRVYVERGGRVELTDVKFKDNEQVMHIIEKIVSPLGRRIDESSPMVDARLLEVGQLKNDYQILIIYKVLIE